MQALQANSVKEYYSLTNDDKQWQLFIYNQPKLQSKHLRF